MQVCSQCKGYGSLVNGQSLNKPNGVTFTLPTQTPVQVCPTCLGTKIYTGAGS